MDKKVELIFTALIIKDENSETYTAILKELDGVIAQGNSVEEAVNKLPAVLAGLIEANRETSKIPEFGSALMTERELVFAR